MSSLSSLVPPPEEPTPRRTIGDVGGRSYVRNAQATADELVTTLARIADEYAEFGVPEVVVSVFLTPAVAAALLARMTPELESVYQVLRCCRVCGCTDDEGCDDGCVWVAVDLCSNCVEAGS